MIQSKFIRNMASSSRSFATFEVRRICRSQKYGRMEVL